MEDVEGRNGVRSVRTVTPSSAKLSHRDHLLGFLPIGNLHFPEYLRSFKRVLIGMCQTSSPVLSLSTSLPPRGVGQVEKHEIIFSSYLPLLESSLALWVR